MFLVNYLAIVVSLVAYSLLGMLWYGPFFGKRWISLTGMADVDMNSPEMKKSQKAGYFSSLISSFIALFTLAILMKVSGISGFTGGVLTGAGVGFGFIAMSLVGEAAWHNTPWALVAINSGYRICGLAVGGIIIGIW